MILDVHVVGAADTDSRPRKRRSAGDNGKSRHANREACLFAHLLQVNTPLLRLHGLQEDPAEPVQASAAVQCQQLTTLLKVSAHLAMCSSVSSGG